MRAKSGRIYRQQLMEQNDSQLGKTLFGKILGGVADVAKGTLNVLVTPIEGVIGKQIIDPKYSDTGFGRFVEKSQEKNSQLNAFLGGAVSSIFTGGAIKVVDIDAKTRAETELAELEQQAKKEGITLSKKEAIVSLLNKKNKNFNDAGRTKAERKINIGIITGLHDSAIKEMDILYKKLQNL